MRGFIRALWGDVSNLRNGKIAKEIIDFKDRDKDWFTIYVFGKENKDWLDEIGYKTILVDEEPSLWSLSENMYRHKLEVFERATEDFDEYVFLDWDCVPVGDISNSWTDLNKKDSFQANLFQYRTKKCLWRKEDTRKTCNGGFVYIRDKSIPSKMIKNYDNFSNMLHIKREIRKRKGLDLRLREKSLLFDDEPSMSKYVDDSCGGWPGVEYYWNHFEPSVCNLRKKSVYGPERLKTKECMFMHNL
jgi:hypothetical protein